MIHKQTIAYIITVLQRKTGAENDGMLVASALLHVLIRVMLQADALKVLCKRSSTPSFRSKVMLGSIDDSTFTSDMAL